MFRRSPTSPLRASFSCAIKQSRLFNHLILRGGKITTYSYSGEDVRQDIIDKYGYDGDLLDIFVDGCERVVHKWHHYIPIYDRYFSKWRGTNIRFLEIGVEKGGSQIMWRKYFGDDAIIYGIDIDKNCKQFNNLSGQVRIGSQDDAQFLRRVVEEMGGIDVVLDDGSHNMKDITASLETLFPKLSDGGLYMIEDLHTSYWSNHGG